MGAQPFLANIYMFASNFAPSGYAMCAGQLLPISQNQALFSLVGTTYGGNGISTFGLPDLRGRTPVGQGQGSGLSSYVLGEQVGTESVTLLSSNLPSHTHTASTSTLTISQVVGGAANANTPVANYPAATAPGVRPEVYATASTASTMAPAMVGVTVSNALTGSNVPISIRNPYLAITYIIALQGIFPSRN